MKYVKMLAIAAVAVMALTAFLRAGSASATVLCKTEMTSGCAATGWEYTNGIVFDMSLEGTTSSETTGGTVLETCSESTVKGTTTNLGSSSETVTVSILELPWGSPFNPCTKTIHSLHNANPATEGTFGTLEIHWISGTDNGTVTGKNSTWTINTIFGSCTYGTSATGTHLGTLTATPSGNKMATLHIEAIIPLRAGGGLCPADYRWTGSYRITEPEPLHVSTT